MNAEKNTLSEPIVSPRPALEGRELDAAVAERILNVALAHGPSNFGFLAISNAGIVSETNCVYCGRRFSDAFFLQQDRCIYAAPHCSTNFAAAMEVVERMQARDYGWTILSHPDHEWTVACFELDRPFTSEEGRGKIRSHSLPQAICLAALAAIDSRKGE